MAATCETVKAVSTPCTQAVISQKCPTLETRGLALKDRRMTEQGACHHLLQVVT